MSVFYTDNADSKSGKRSRRLGTWRLRLFCRARSQQPQQVKCDLEQHCQQSYRVCSAQLSRRSQLCISCAVDAGSRRLRRPNRCDRDCVNFEVNTTCAPSSDGTHAHKHFNTPHNSSLRAHRNRPLRRCSPLDSSPTDSRTLRRLVICLLGRALGQ